VELNPPTNHQKTRWIAHPAYWLGLALLFAAGFKLWLTFGGWVPFNADEAVVGLMARHILQGAWPTFFYGQAYMGSLDAWFVAGAFRLFGEQVWAIRLVQMGLYLLFLATTAGLGKKVFGNGSVGVLGAFLLAIPAVNVTLYTTASLGGYGEALVLGNLILLGALDIQGGSRPAPLWKWGLVGFLSGFGLWVFGLTLVYSLPAIIFLIIGLFQPGLSTAESRSRWQAARTLLALAVGGVIGALPWWAFALSHGWTALLHELGGGAVAGVEKLAYGEQVLRHLLNLLLFGSTAAFGLRPPWEVRWLVLPLLPFVLIFWLGMLAYQVKTCSRTQHGSQYSGRILLTGVILALALGFVFTPFGVDPSGRYFLPLAAPLALFAADLILHLRKKYGNWTYGLVFLLIGYQLIGTLQSAFKFPPGITTQFYSPTQIDHRYDQALIDFLIRQDERFGYSNYWVAYPLAFLSEESLIFTPRLPYHIGTEVVKGSDPIPVFTYTERDNRYQPYDQIVAESDRTAYISTHHPELNQYLRERFGELGVSWQEAQIGDFHIFYRLSRAVRPAEVGLGETSP